MRSSKAYSLVEIMVVIGIIAFLATMAAPFYADYASKSKVSLAAVVLNELNTKTIALYNEGLVTTGITELNIDGVVWEDATAISYDRYPVTDAQLFLPGDGIVNDNAWMFCVYVADLGFDGYVSGPLGTNSRVCSKVVVESGIFTTYCGRFDPNNPLEIPLEYLPEECDVAAVNTY